MKHLILSVFLAFSLYAYNDLGTFGPTYDVQEENLKDVMMENLKKKKSEIKALAKKAYESGLIYKSDIPFSKKDKIVESELVLNVPNSSQKAKAKDIPYAIDDSMCIVSFESYNILDDIIEHFGEKCRYVFLNVDIRKISQNNKYKNINKFIGNDILFHIIDIDVTPLKITLKGNKMTKRYLDYREVKKRVKQKLLNKNSDAAK